MLRSREMSPKNRFTAAGYIFSEGKRLEALSLKLMEIIVSGKQGIERRKFDAPYFIREVAAVTVPSLASDGMTLDMRWEQGEVEIEPDLFKTLMINLIDNARKASRKGQTIELFGKREEDGYAFYVRDHGRGMKKEDLSRITEPFYMIDKSRSRAQNGAGLDLVVTSGWRSWAYQEQLFEDKVGRVMAETGLGRAEAEELAAAEVARPGTSEHQLGLAVDIISNAHPELDESWAQTEEAEWLKENCADYGFILRYPPDKSGITGIVWEPWHFRSVGEEAAQYIMENGLCLEEYLEEQQ